MPKGYFGERNWTREQLLTLDELLHQGLSDQAIGKRLDRSANAVRIQRKRAGLRARRRRHMSAGEVADRLGVGCSKTVAWWISRGWLRARKGHGAGPHRAWWITIEALDEFVADPRYWHLWDVARVTDRDVLDACRERLTWGRTLTAGEVAARLCVTRGTVNAWIHRGHLPAVRPGGGNWLVWERDLMGFVPPSQVDRHGRRPRRFTPDEDALLWRLRASGASWAEIAGLLGRNQGSVAGRWGRLSARAPVEAVAA